MNRLRGRVRVQVDGQLKTGRDVVIGALLGADEFGFATAPLVAQGCIMMRKCHLNTCPVGVATQDPVLRKRFAGKPEHVVNYFFFVAEEVRQIMASLGIAKFADLIGRSEMLDTLEGINHWKAQHLDFSRLFFNPDPQGNTAHRFQEHQEHGLEKALDQSLLKFAQPIFIGEKKSLSGEYGIRNSHRSVGAMLSGEIGRRFGSAGLPTESLSLQFKGSAGQSFGAFLAHGVTFTLIGEANDYVGKGLSGGNIAIRPAPEFRGDPRENIIIGNTALYGATSGSAYINGVAGERFCVRNSGATAVVEGVGDHGGEYMTGGVMVVLGKTGRNFAAGMSGGVAFVFDEDGRFQDRCNLEMVKLLPIASDTPIQVKNINDPRASHLGFSDESLLRGLLENHAKFTGSEIAKYILNHFEQEKWRFVKVMHLNMNEPCKNCWVLMTVR
jgi:glutamate synthase (NADPH/NADH) large chain